MRETIGDRVQNDPRVLLIYREMIPSIRLSGHCQMEYLAAQGKAQYRAAQEWRLTNADLNWADIALLGRLDSGYEKKLAEALHRAGKYLIYIIDDDLLNVPPDVSSAVHYNRPDVKKNIRDMLALSDAILSPSPLLLQKYATGGKAAIQIEEPAISPLPYVGREMGRPVRIGFAGSVDRTMDIERILSDALLRVKRTYGDSVQFEFFGAAPSFAQALGARVIPYCDSYEKYRETLDAVQWDIGLAPMPDTPFHACKHYNKFVEYAAAGIVGVFSDVQPYARLRDQTDAAVLCANTADAWTEAISRLITDGALREKLRQGASRLAHGAMSVPETALELSSRLPEVSDTSKSLVRFPFYRAIPADVLARAWHIFRRYGLKAPATALKRLRGGAIR